MGTRSTVRSIAWALSLCVAAGCEQAPLVDMFIAEPAAPPRVPCAGRSELCNRPDELVSSLSAARSISLFPCTPSGSLGEDAVDTTCPVPSPGTTWRNKAVLIEADEPREVLVSKVDLTDARVLLSGPVTLRVRDIPSIERLELQSSSPGAQVVFEHVAASHVTIGDATRAFAGHVSAHHTRFDDLSLNATSVELDSAVIARSFLSAERIDSGDGVLEDVVIDVGDGLFAPSSLTDVRIVGCDTLAFFGSSLTRSIIPRCTGEPTRLYDSKALDIVLDGLIEGAGGTIRSSRLGRYDPSEYVLWDVYVSEGSMFCNEAHALKSTATIRCTYCEDQAFDVGPACNLEQPVPEAEAAPQNPCQALDLTTQCAAPLPERLRPLRD